MLVTSSFPSILHFYEMNSGKESSIKLVQPGLIYIVAPHVAQSLNDLHRRDTPDYVVGELKPGPCFMIVRTHCIVFAMTAKSLLSSDILCNPALLSGQLHQLPWFHPLSQERLKKLWLRQLSLYRSSWTGESGIPHHCQKLWNKDTFEMHIKLPSTHCHCCRSSEQHATAGICIQESPLVLSQDAFNM